MAMGRPRCSMLVLVQLAVIISTHSKSDALKNPIFHNVLQHISMQNRALYNSHGCVGTRRLRGGNDYEAETKKLDTILIEKALELQAMLQKEEMEEPTAFAEKFGAEAGLYLKNNVAPLLAQAANEILKVTPFPNNAAKWLSGWFDRVSRLNITNDEETPISVNRNNQSSHEDIGCKLESRSSCGAGIMNTASNLVEEGPGGVYEKVEGVDGLVERNSKHEPLFVSYDQIESMLSTAHGLESKAEVGAASSHGDKFLDSTVGGMEPGFLQKGKGKFGIFEEDHEQDRKPSLQHRTAVIDPFIDELPSPVNTTMDDVEGDRDDALSMLRELRRTQARLEACLAEDFEEEEGGEEEQEQEQEQEQEEEARPADGAVSIQREVDAATQGESPAPPPAPLYTVTTSQPDANIDLIPSGNLPSGLQDSGGRWRRDKMQTSYAILHSDEAFKDDVLDQGLREQVQKEWDEWRQLHGDATYSSASRNPFSNASTMQDGANAANSSDAKGVVGAEPALRPYRYLGRLGEVEQGRRGDGGEAGRAGTEARRQGGGGRVVCHGDDREPVRRETALSGPGGPATAKARLGSDGALDAVPPYQLGRAGAAVEQNLRGAGTSENMLPALAVPGAVSNVSHDSGAAGSAGKSESSAALGLAGAEDMQGAGGSEPRKGTAAAAIPDVCGPGEASGTAGDAPREAGGRRLRRVASDSTDAPLLPAKRRRGGQSAAARDRTHDVDMQDQM
jgi:hypothetical protein